MYFSFDILPSYIPHIPHHQDSHLLAEDAKPKHETKTLSRQYRIFGFNAATTLLAFDKQSIDTARIQKEMYTNLCTEMNIF